jgi:hypothetical protein
MNKQKMFNEILKISNKIYKLNPKDISHEDLRIILVNAKREYKAEVEAMKNVD